MKADKQKITKLLKTAKGQTEGIIKMVEENRYCIDISNQLLATISILKKINREILHSHLSSCVIEEKDDELKKQKIAEIYSILEKLSS